MSDNKLKPCPFCGSEAFMYLTRVGIKVSCENGCVAMPPRFDVGFAGKGQASNAWNRRAAENHKEDGGDWDDHMKLKIRKAMQGTP